MCRLKLRFYVIFTIVGDGVSFERKKKSLYFKIRHRVKCIIIIVHNRDGRGSYNVLITPHKSIAFIYLYINIKFSFFVYSTTTTWDKNREFRKIFESTIKRIYIYSRAINETNGHFSREFLFRKTYLNQYMKSVYTTQIIQFIE